MTDFYKLSRSQMKSVLFPLLLFPAYSPVKWLNWIRLDVRALNITTPKTVNQHLCNDSHSSLSSSMFLRHPLVCNTLYTVYLSSLFPPLPYLSYISSASSSNTVSILFPCSDSLVAIPLYYSSLYLSSTGLTRLAITNTSSNSCFTVNTMFMNPLTLQKNKLHLTFHYETKKCIFLKLETSE